jgi:hypothetical protein
MKSFTINLDEKNAKKALEFFSVYEFESQLATANLTSKTIIGDRKSRICRFCGKTKPEVTFKKDAHFIPQFMGNRYLLSSFECDICNEKFGELYENSFANYLGAYRPFSFVSNSKNNMHPKHKEKGRVENEEKVKLSIQQTENTNVQVFYEHPFNDSIVYDKENKKMTINATRQPYIPIYIFKLFLKMAISMVNNDDLPHFKNSISFLLDNTQNEKFKTFGLLNIFVHTLYGPPMFRDPLVILYKKKKEHSNALYPDRTSVIYSGNQIYQIYIPLNDLDNKFLGQKISLLHYPILLDEIHYKNGVTYESYSSLFDGNDKIVGEKQKLEFSYTNAEFNISDPPTMESDDTAGNL